MAFGVTYQSDDENYAPFRMNYPLGTESPTLLDQHGRSTREGFRERLAVDHFFDIDAGGNNSIDDSDNIGEHKHVMFNAPRATPTPAASKGMLYTKDFNSKAELTFTDEDAQEVQITSAGNLLLTADAVEAAKANILNSATHITDGSGVITLAVGATSDVGIRWEHLSTDTAAFCDKDTIEIDATNGLQLKDPTTPSGGNINLVVSGAPVSGWKRYTGSASSQTIDCGFVIRHFVIRQATGGGVNTNKAVEGIVDNNSLLAWKQKGEGTTSVGITLTNSQTLTLDADEGDINNGTSRTYTIFVEGVRL